MNVIAGNRKTVLVVLERVSIKSCGDKMVLFGPNEMVEKVLKTSSIDTLISVHYELHSALAALCYKRLSTARRKGQRAP